MTPRPCALVVSPRFLFPLDEGGKIRTVNILRQMKGGRLELLLASPAPNNASVFAQELATICDRFVSWPAQNRSIMRRVMSLAGRLPVSVATDYSMAGHAVVKHHIIKDADFVLIDFPHTAVLLPQCVVIPSMVFAHNVEAEILQRHADLTTGVWHRVWAGQARKMRLFEGATLKRFDCVLAVSERDADKLHEDYKLKDVRHIGTGVDLNFYAYSSPVSEDTIAPSAGTIIFVGAMDSAANIDAVKFLFDEIWPLVTRARPQARALIVGRNPPKTLVTRIRKAWPGITFTGFVDDVRPYIKKSDVSVIPIRTGSGTRIKAFEAMAVGRPVVSTRVGMEGLEVTAGTHYLAADDPNGFADAILRLLDDECLRVRVASAARASLEVNLSWAVVARLAEEICLEILEGRRVARFDREAVV